ncbi:MAG: hypothetical protein KKF56_05255 [Nanoarchaeota archaeon]|nr:hypothetical protein [Nanoarchaeota archaeon]
MKLTEKQLREKFSKCEVCGTVADESIPTDELCGICDKCFARKDVQKALFRI